MFTVACQRSLSHWLLWFRSENIDVIIPILSHKQQTLSMYLISLSHPSLTYWNCNLFWLVCGCRLLDLFKNDVTQRQYIFYFDYLQRKRLNNLIHITILFDLLEKQCLCSDANKPILELLKVKWNWMFLCCYKCLFNFWGCMAFIRCAANCVWDTAKLYSLTVSVRPCGISVYVTHYTV